MDPNFLPPELQELVAAEYQRVADDKRVNGIAYYKPHAKQALFHASALYTRRLLRPGNRFGKSECGAAEDVAWLLGHRPWLEDSDPNSTIGIPKRAVKGLLVCQDWSKANEIFTNNEQNASRGKLFKLLPEAAVKRVVKDTAGNVTEIHVQSARYTGVSVLKIFTVAQWKLDHMRAESASYDFIHVDEPIPEALWNGISRGLIDRNGSAWITCTPIAEPWISNLFIPQGCKDKINVNEVNSFKPNYAVIVGSSTDNPYLSTTGVATYFQGLTPTQLAVRLNGDPDDREGRVFSEFNEALHVLEPHQMPEGWTEVGGMWRPPFNWTVHYAADTHPTTPHAVLFAAVSPFGQVIFFHEIWEHVPYTELADDITEVIADYTLGLELIDPAAFNPDPASKLILARELQNLGLNVERGSKDLKNGLMVAKAYFSTGVKFTSNLVRFQQEIENYRWNPKTPNKPYDRDDHFMENYRRLVVAGMPYVDYVPKLPNITPVNYSKNLTSGFVL